MRNIFKWLRRGIILGMLLVVVWLFTPAYLHVPYENQFPTLPNGCESVSVAMVGRFYGIDMTGPQVVDRYLDKGAIGQTDPHEAYIGDPYGDGYYAYPEVIADTANRMFDEAQLPVQAHAPVFLDIFHVAYELHQGQPVISWITVDDKWPKRQEGTVWNLPSGRSYEPYENLHVVVVDGIAGWNIHLNDPIRGDRWVSLPTFLKMQIGMGLKGVTFDQAPTQR